MRCEIMKKAKANLMTKKLLGGIIFLAVFVLNIVLFIQSDQGSISIKTLKAYASTGGTNNEEEEDDGYELENKQTTTKSDTCVAVGGKKGKVTITTITITCIGSGLTECTAGKSDSVSGCVEVPD
jgi:hypothetical protein